MRVPALPAADGAILAAHASAHATLAARLDDAPVGVRQLFAIVQRWQVIEAVAYVQPVNPVDDHTRLFPPPRAHLTLEQQRRLDGAGAAFRHLDARSTLVRLGVVGHVLEQSTPRVVHALLEGPDPSQRETNAGIYRATPTGWRPEVNPFRHPGADEVDTMVSDAVAMAVEAPAPAVTRAAWLTFTMLCIHPFVDGNGRTARALYMAVAGADSSLGIDWGALEQWSRTRTGYIAALQAGQRHGSYVPEELDAAPFIDYAVAASTSGARRCTERVEALAAAWSATETFADDQRVVLLTLECFGGATASELVARTGLQPHHLRTTVNELLQAGRVGWSDRPAGRRSAASPERRHLTVIGGTPTTRR